MNGELLIPILVPLGFFALVFGIVYMHKKENLAMIDKGMNPKLYFLRPYGILKWSMLLIGAGVGLFLAYMFDQYMSRNEENEALYFALIAIGGGIGLFVSFKMELNEMYRREAKFGSTLAQPGTTLPPVPSEL